MTGSFVETCIITTPQASVRLLSMVSTPHDRLTYSNAILV